MSSIDKVSLRDLRLEGKLSQERLAVVSGVSRSEIAHIEGGNRTNPSLDVAIRIACALRLPLATVAAAISGYRLAGRGELAKGMD